MSLPYLSSTLALNLTYTAKGNQSGPLAAPGDKQSISLSDTFVTGSAALQANQLYCGVRTLAASASENLALYGSLIDNLGNTLNFTKIKGIAVALLNTTAASSITIGNAASNSWAGPLGSTGTEQIFNNGFYCNCNPSAGGWAVTTTNVLKVVNNDSSNVATYLILLMGA